MGYVFLNIKDLCISQNIVTRIIPLNNCKTGEISFSSFYQKHGESKKDAEFNIYVNSEHTEKLSHPEQELKTAEKSEVHSSKPESKQSEIEKTEATEKAVEIKDIIGLSDKSTDVMKAKPGSLKLTIHKGIKLAKTGLIGKSDPYVVVEHNNSKFKSKTVKDNQNPVWDFIVERKLSESSVGDIKISVFDEDIGKDDPMGYTFLNLQDLCDNKIITNMTLPLQSCKSGEIVVSSIFTYSDVKESSSVVGTTHFSEVNTMEKTKDDRKSEVSLPKNVELDSCETLSEPSQSEASLIPVEEKVDIDAGHLKLIIHSGTNLIKTDIIGKSDPYVVVEYNKKKFKSKTVKNNQNPYWDFIVDCEIVENSDEDIKVSVFDEDIGKDDPMGYVFLDIKDLCISQSIVTRNILLNNCETGEINFSSFFNKHGKQQKSAELNIIVNTDPTEKLTHTKQELKIAENSLEHSTKTESVQSDTEIIGTTKKAFEINEMSDEKIAEKSGLKFDLGNSALTKNIIKAKSGSLKLTIHKGIKLAKTGLIGKSDPYVVIEHGDDMFKSKTVKNDQNPVWDFVVEKKLTESSIEDIKISVFDEDIGKDDPMGFAFLNMQDLYENKNIIYKSLPLKSCKS